MGGNMSQLESLWEKQFFHKHTHIPYFSFDNFPQMGLFTSLRFLEWVSQNPQGVVSLPTGKTPEHFIKWTNFILQNWTSAQVQDLRSRYQIQFDKPELSQLTFVQIDEFYPIASQQTNSFSYYVNKFYLEGFGLDKRRALLINADNIPLPQQKHFSEVFPTGRVDLSLRFRECQNSLEELQQEAIFSIDQWCSEYETRIRELGGIGFFLGGIGPDGHIAFNVKGTDHFSTTRLTKTNFQTQAVAAGDLGGMEISRNRLVITIGLATIVYNPQAVAIIIAAGSAKAPMVKNALEESASNLYPATVLQTLKHARFFVTQSAASLLKEQVDHFYQTGGWTHQKSEQAIMDLCQTVNKYGADLTTEDLNNSRYGALFPHANLVQAVKESIVKKIEQGLQREKHQVFYHTGPHHDDIMLGLLPHISKQLREPSNDIHFAVMTSGFTAVTNSFLKEKLEHTQKLLQEKQIQMIDYATFFESGFQYKWDKDVSHYLNKLAAQDHQGMLRGLSHRLVRALVQIYSIKDEKNLMATIEQIITTLKESYDGEKNPKPIQTLKGMLREFEEELVWGHFGVQSSHVHHLRLGFYQGDIFTELPKRERDVMPILNQLRQIKPTVISLALDPEGSGPDTHYKTLQAIAEAVRLWQLEGDVGPLRIWGYRNVWYRFSASEANVIVPVSLDVLAVLDSSFRHCYLSQVNASFPSYLLDGRFSELTAKVWVSQLKTIQLLLGKDFFYLHQDPRVRASDGLLFFKEMSVPEFLNYAGSLEKAMEAVAE